ncbi:MAG: ATP-binding protein [Cyanobacteria bacterium P01_H01_bin.121]
MLYIICGSPGAGKSTYGAKLAAQQQATLLDIDTVTEQLVQIGLQTAGHNPDDRDSAYFKATYRQPIYDTLFAIAAENLKHQSVVVVGPFTREQRQADWPSKVAAQLQTNVEIHYVTCQPELRKQRIAQRGQARDRTKLTDWEHYLQYYEEVPPVFEHVYVDTSN